MLSGFVAERKEERKMNILATFRNNLFENLYQQNKLVRVDLVHFFEKNLVLAFLEKYVEQRSWKWRERKKVRDRKKIERESE